MYWSYVAGVWWRWRQGFTHGKAYASFSFTCFWMYSCFFFGKSHKSSHLLKSWTLEWNCVFQIPHRFMDLIFFVLYFTCSIGVHWNLKFDRVSWTLHTSVFVQQSGNPFFMVDYLLRLCELEGNYSWAF